MSGSRSPACARNVRTIESISAIPKSIEPDDVRIAATAATVLHVMSLRIFRIALVAVERRPTGLRRLPVSLD